MIPLAADEDFDNRIVRGVLRDEPDVDMVTVQDVGLSSTEDPDVLEWAATEGRVLFSHDANTMIHQRSPLIEVRHNVVLEGPYLLVVALGHGILRPGEGGHLLCHRPALGLPLDTSTIHHLDVVVAEETEDP